MHFKVWASLNDAAMPDTGAYCIWVCAASFPLLSCCFQDCMIQPPDCDDELGNCGSIYVWVYFMSFYLAVSGSRNLALHLVYQY